MNTQAQIDSYVETLAQHSDVMARLRRDGIAVPYKGTQINVPWDEYQSMTFDQVLTYCEAKLQHKS